MTSFKPNIIPNRFKDQAIIVTGGALKGNIGQGAVLRYRAEGGIVHVFDRDGAALDQFISGLASGPKAYAHQLDITDETAVAAAVDKVVVAHGKLDVLVHSAAIVGPNGMDIDEVPTADFLKTIGINVVGAYHVIKHSVRAMRPKGYGRIAVLASIAGREGNPKMAAYSTSKGAVIAMVKSVGKELAQTGITINAFCPSTILTPMVERDCTPDRVAFMLSKIPMNELGTVDSIVDLIAHYTAPGAYYVTAQAIDHTGGRNVQ